MIRQPIVTIMGHVDHGKTSLADAIRGSGVAAKEAGGITQAIGASIIPASIIKKLAGALLDSLKISLTIPGLLFIDTPGHAAFTNLRKRGGNLADMAILVIDINEGLMPQTIECIQILKQYKTPFIVALNKLDTLDGWKHEPLPLAQLINRQQQATITALDTKLYNVVGKLFEQGLQADRFDRISDVTKQLVIVPTSARTGDGIPELLMMLAGLAQKYFEKKLQVNVSGPAKGTVLEVKDVKGLGITVDAIIYDGTLKVNDTIVLGTNEAPVVTKVKALLVPDELAEMREKKTKFSSVKEASAAMGVKISAPLLDQVVAGSPLLSGNDTETLKAQIQAEMQSVLIETEEQGLIIKADTIGSLEALSVLLKEKNIPVSKARVGPINKKDLADAESMKDPLKSVILGFNIPKPEDSAVKIITAEIIYRLIEDYEDWVKGQQKALEIGEMELLLKPCRIELLKGYVFRQSNPAVVGVEVHAGVLRPNTPLMTKEGNQITMVKSIQQEQENLPEAKKGARPAASFTDVIIGRQLQEGDILWTALPEEQFRKYKQFRELLKPDEKEALREIAEIMRVKNPVWGI